MNFYRKRPDYITQTDAPVICYKLGETGFWPIYTKKDVTDLNWDGVTEEILESAEIGSMFGWDVPGAKLAKDFARARL